MKNLSAEGCGRLNRRGRCVVRLEEFTDDEMALIAKAEVPAEYAYLDSELKDWKGSEPGSAKRNPGKPVVCGS